jgi:hypothetical protein
LTAEPGERGSSSLAWRVGARRTGWGKVMGWMDANEYFLIVATARDRVDDLLSSTGLAIERAAIADRRGVTEPAHFCDAQGCTLSHLPV